MSPARGGFPWEPCPACGVLQVWDLKYGPVPPCMACDGIEMAERPK
jgi:hypothetical protein